MISWSDETMKAISKARLMIGTFSASSLIIGLMIGLATPAVAPSKAEAQMRMLAPYVNATSLTDTELVGLLRATGFQGQALKYAWAVAKKESHGNPLDYNGNRRTGDNSFGLFQINMLDQMGANRRTQFGLSSNAELLNPVVNAKVAYLMSNAGRDWSAWKGVHTTVVQTWLKAYPYKATTTKAHKAKVIAKAKAKVEVVHRSKSKAISKGKAK